MAEREGCERPAVGGGEGMVERVLERRAEGKVGATAGLERDCAKTPKGSER